MPSYSWTQPICQRCWALQNPGRVPVLTTIGDTETCAWCGSKTTTGIYVRVDPATVEFPTPKDLT
jgi:hypothetical protein